MQNLIELKDVYFKTVELEILSNINLTISQKQVITLIGPNGAGKTTLAKIIMGLLKPTSGTIMQKDHIRIGYVPQKLHLNHYMPITVRVFLQLSHDTKIDNNTILNILATVGADNLVDRSLHKLSGGQMQKVLLARSIIRKPNLLILDEPMQGVDHIWQNNLYKLINSLKDTMGLSVLMVSHDLHLVMQNTDEVICLNKHICCSGSPNNVTQKQAFIDMFGIPMMPYVHKHDAHVCMHE